MERRAVWRPHPDDPKTALGWIFQTEWQSRLSLWTALLIAIPIVILATAVSPWAFLALPAIFVNSGRPETRPQDLTALATIPAPGPAFACQVLIQRGSSNVVVGVDEGIVTFFDGWLHFAGLRTEFSIRSTDSAKLDPSSFDPRIFVAGATIVLHPRYATGSPDLYVVARDWSRSKRKEAGEPILPPLAVHPTGFARAWIDIVRMLVNGIAGSAILLVLIAAFESTSASYFAIAPVFFFGGDALWRLRSLHKLRKQDRQALAQPSNSALDPKSP